MSTYLKKRKRLFVSFLYVYGYSDMLATIIEIRNRVVIGN